MEYIKKETPAYNLHFIKTDKFKKIKIKINFKEVATKEKIVYRNLLSLILLEATKKYNTKRLLDIECENLYNIGVGFNTFMSGNYHVLSLSTNFLNEKYTEEGMNEKSLKFFFDFIFDPNVSNNEFFKQTFDNAKNILKEDIESYDDNPGNFAFSRLYANMFPNSPLSYRGCGYIEDLETITVSNLYEYYKELIKKDVIDIFIIGDININNITKIISDNFDVNTIKNTNISHFIEQKEFKKSPVTIKEKKNINQSILILAAKIKDVTDFERMYVLSVYNYILGGSPDSKLFKDVREKNSLCYYITSSHSGIASLELINSGIDYKNYEKVLKITKQKMKEMSLGNFTEEDIEHAKINSKAALKEIEDNESTILALYEAHEYLGYDLLEDRNIKIDKVTKEDVINITKKIKLDTIFLLEGSKRNEKEED
ncbi:MAG TPA: pitrilysin family protein [Bacilli bacterium]|nr:pitrilysin family protein [Bacilli bacterium]